MTTSIVFTFIGEDKPGLVEKLTNTVSTHNGNWLESRMSQLAGQFAGITRVQIASEQAEQLRTALTNLSNDSLIIVVQPGTNNATGDMKQLSLSLIGNDRPGILKELSSALAVRQINVCEMNTNLTSAPMTAELLFEAHAKIQVPESLDLNELTEKLDEIANDLTVDINLD